MRFKVIHRFGRFEVVGETGQLVDWFATEKDAQAKAEWLTQEYERVLAIL